MEEMKSATFVLISILFLTTLVSAQERVSAIAPSVLPATTRQMKTAGYWISRHPAPDQVLLTPSQIVQFNSQAQSQKTAFDVENFPKTLAGDEIKKIISAKYQKLSSQVFYRRDNGKVDSGFFDAMHQQLNLEKVDLKTWVRYGFIVHYADQRLLPTDEALYAEKGDVDFDELQNSALDVGTPVVVLHSSADGRWVYVRSETSDGWIHVEDVALGKKQDFIIFFGNKLFVVNLSPKADVFLDENLTQYYDYVQMSTRFALIKGEWPGILKVRLPTRDEKGELVWRDGFLKSEDFNSGYLSYTPRHVLEQAFKLLNQPYGWGGMYGEQDCSRFLQEVFGTVGISLPRNSSDQIQIGKLLGEFTSDVSKQEKIKVLEEQGLGGTTLLGMKGHIMLYLGAVDGLPYAIHATWGYRENTDGEDRTRVLNRAVVSNLLLGNGSKKGSLLERLSRITDLSN